MIWPSPKQSTRNQKDSDWSVYRKDRISVNNPNEHAISNYYDNIEAYLEDSGKNNNVLLEIKYILIQY